MNLTRCALIALCGLALSGWGFGSSTFGQEKDKKKDPDSLDRDYRTELPRIPPTAPSMAVRRFRMPDGFSIRAIATEPVVTDPVALAFDEFERIYVVEMRGYSEQENENLGRVRRLEDRDGDGFYETSQVFAEGLSWPTAITYYEGGVFVAAAPYVFYFKDTTGDGFADEKKTVYSGFSRSNVQGLINSFRWGLDNRIHGATSSSGATVKSHQQPDAAPLVLRGRDFSIEPRNQVMRPESGGAQHGLSFNRWGEKFVCSNSNHIQQVLYDDAYAARNPYAKAPGARASIAADGPQADVFRSSPIEPWRIVRTRLRVKGIVRGPVEGGGTPAGYFTGATGVTLFRGDAWGPKYVDWAIIGDVGSNLVHRKQLSRDKGVVYRASRVDQKSEFLTSTDIWFRPVQFANGPSGGLYVLDMYREVIEHPKSLPPVIKQHLDLTSGRDRGRLWLISATNAKTPKRGKLGEMSSEALVDELNSPNGWRRETASRLLYERNDARVAGRLEQLAVHGMPEGKLHALYVLEDLGELRADLVARLLKDAHPQVRRHALKLSEGLAPESAELRSQLCGMTSDDDFVVRRQLAFSLGAFSSSARNAALARLIQRDGADPQMRFAVLTSLVEGAGEVLAALVKSDSAIKHQATIALLATQIARQRRGDDVAQLMKLLPSAKRKAKVLQTILAAMALKDNDPLAKQIAAATGGEASQVMKELVAKASNTALNEKLDGERRAAAVHALRLGDFETVGETLEDLLQPAQPATVQRAALETAGGFGDDVVAEWILSRWLSLTPKLRAVAGDILLSRETWTPKLLDAIEMGTIASSDLEAGRLRILAGSANQRLAARATKLLAKSATRGDRQEVINRYQTALGAGDSERGRKLFKSHCASCHQVQGVGHAIGPNLAAMRNRGDEAILLNVLAPNREVNPQYMTYVVQKADGRSLSGIIASESANSILLKRGDNETDQVLRIDIDAMRSTGLSLMPEGFEKKIKPSELADLIEYLKSVN